MFQIEPLRKKAQLYYESGKFYGDLLNEREIFPLRYPFKKPTEKVLVASIEKVQAQVASLQKLGASIEYHTVAYKTIGTQRLPAALCFKTANDYLRFLGKTEEYRAFMHGFEAAERLGLGEFLRQKPQVLLKHLDVRERLLAVVRFFLEHPNPGIYVRELPIEGVDTKFIQSHRKVLDALLQEALPPKTYDASLTKLTEYGFEKKYGLRYPSSRVRLRLLDPTMRISGLEDLEITCEAFNALGLQAERLFIIENLTTFLAFPTLHSAVVLYGGGFKAGQLRQLDFTFAKEIFYWGDIDTHGFAILSSVRSVQPQVHSFLMDEATLRRFRHLCVEEPTPTTADLPNLTPDEAALYDALRFGTYRGLRLEQERIPMDRLL
jgi:hypothetical protein